MINTIFKGKVVTLNLETVTLPTGATVELEVVRHPGAAAIVPMKDTRTVVLIRQYRLAAGGFIYEIPAGKLYPGEDPKLCAERELEEEIGYRGGTIKPLETFFTAPGFTDEVMHLFLATNLVKTKQKLDHDEVLEVVEMSLDEAIAKIRDGTIRDAKTIVGLQSVYLRQRLAK
ncbi:MAG: NUDIX hydrolase [Nitrospira sp.]|nr:NUDIX hydrolase [Nitrospira sp.]